ncbi:MAG: TonB-dependent receptor [Cyclobacteriaceae bacterium]
MLIPCKGVSQLNRFFSGLLLLLLFAYSATAQENYRDARISVDFQSISLEDVLNNISEQSGVSFSYNPRRISVDQKITYRASRETVVKILEELALMTSFEYEMIEGKIILKPKAKNVEKQKATLSGFIKDSSSGEALIGASVWVEELKVGATSNVFGFYSLTLPSGEYDVSFSYIGFNRQVRKIDLQTSQSQNVSLQIAPALLEEIIVTSIKPQLVNEIQVSKTHVRPSTIAEKPSFFGEPDAVKSLEMVPGVKMHSDGSTFYYVRGGDRDQNMILIDDAPIFNPSHLLGLFSTIIPDAVNDITLYKGSMPASLGGRLSSIMDVRTRKGNDQQFEVSGNVALLSSKLSLEGPIKKEKSSFLLSSRVSRVKWIFALFNDDIESFQFHDLTGKLNFDLSQDDKLYFSFYSGGDKFLTSNNGIEWSNRATTVRWNHVFSKRLFLNTTLAAGVYDYFLHTNRSNNTKWNSHLSNINIKGDFSYFKNPNEEFTFGLSLGGYNFNPGNVSRNGSPIPPVISVRNSNEFVLYGNHEIRLGNHWGLNYGLRISTWVNEGEAFEFVFDDNRNPVDTLFFKKGDKYQNYQNLEPRISVSYNLNDNSSFKASAARNVQNIHLITNSISPFSSFEVWLPSSVNIKPQIANQVVLGYYHYLENSGLSFELESFYKRMKNQIDYEAHAETIFNPLLERELRFGEARSYGMEFQVKKEEGRLRSWVGYSYSRAKRKFAEVNNGRVFNAFYDRPHQVNITMSYDLNLRWNIGMNWTYYTGAPYSSPASFYNFNGLEIPLYDQKNNDRLPDYHRLDITATLNLNKNEESRFKHNLMFSIYNFYNQKNTLFVNYNKTEQSDGGFKVPSNLLDKNTVSTQFYLFQFTPSIAYNFKWK